MSSLPSIDLIGPARCTGCFGCLSACALNALSFELDRDGFYRPVVDREACNECGRCQLACPVIPEEPAANSVSRAEPLAFGAWSKDEAVRAGSSSGGIFSELSRVVIAGGGAVAGCVWAEGWTPEHQVTRTWRDVERMRGSKYVPSRVGFAYQRTLAALEEPGSHVLFSGTPCQVVAMERALSPEQRARTLLVDFVCHGVPSLRAFHRYLGELFDGDPVTRFTFRDKTLGWLSTIGAESASGLRHLVPLHADAFGRGFADEHLFQMEACYACEFARLPRSADLTLADFWGCPPEWHDTRGVSLVLVNTEAGLAAVRGIEQSGRVLLESCDLPAAIAKNPRARGGAYPIPKHRRAFLDGLADGESYRRLAARYFPGKAALYWQAFLASDQKIRLLTDFFGRRVRRLVGRSA